MTAPLFQFDVEADRSIALVLGRYRISLELAKRLDALHCSEPEKINAAIQNHYRVLLEQTSDPGERSKLYGEAYDTIAALYIGCGFSESGVSPALREVMRPFFRGKDVIELGCGKGQLACELSTEFKSYLGVDVSDSYLSSAVGLNSSQSHLRFLNASLTDADLGENSADIVYSNDVVEHVSPNELDLIMTRAYRALRPNGVIVTLTPNRHFGPFDASRVFRKVGESSAGLHLQEYGYAELREVYARAGFVQPRAFLFPLRAVAWLLRHLPLSVERFGVHSRLKEMLEGIPFIRRRLSRAAGLWIVFLWARKPSA